MESLKYKRRAERKSKMRKLSFAILLATSLSAGTTAFATVDELRTGFQNLVTALVNPMLPEIDREISKAGSQYSIEITEYIKTTNNVITQEIVDYKKAEIYRGIDELKKYRDEKMKSIDDAANAEIEEGKKNIKTQTDENIGKGKALIDKALEKSR
ncbi:hypothetical protein [Bacillus sp. CECT 9360]|uniref:hypothetical protein n=1 Tax=Bacillus sp. CECT 9360 TaxID=2845821 RepID=UPI001E40292F|nr:hypothetical protein [Bacillus sp. CECT 9360]CAH0344839.1 hypothetical protein BCI9360_01108 [Bacillus sp. CECT 9360]